jgi:hypothetical protein
MSWTAHTNLTFVVWAPLSRRTIMPGRGFPSNSDWLWALLSTEKTAIWWSVLRSLPLDC